MKILLVEDDESCIAVLTRSLASHHYVLDVVQDGEMGWTYGSTFEYDLIVLDIMLPKLDGISLCQRFRSEGYATPILLLTAEESSTAKVQGLDAGADDYVVKPFDQAELVARIRALLRRGSSNPFPLLTWGELLLNPSTCEVTYNGQLLSLTTKEYELLELLLQDSHHVFSTEEILDRLWSSEEFPSEATVRSHIRRVRQKLLMAGAPQDFIATMHGRGYYLKAPALEAGTALSVVQDVPAGVPEPLHDAGSGRLNPRSADAQQQYLAFLNETWMTTKPKSLEQLALLSAIVEALQSDRLDAQQQAQGQQMAHKLAGTLGIFGQMKAMHLARQVEHWLAGRQPLLPKHAPLLDVLVTALQDEIQSVTLVEPSQLPTGHAPLLLILGGEAGFTQSLVKVAESRGIRTAISPTLDVAEGWLTSETPPDALLFRLPSGASQAESGSEPRLPSLDSLLLLSEFARRYPTLPILVVTDQGDLQGRLEILRRGGKLFLEPSAIPEQVIAAVVQMLSGSHLPSTVMIVDDDRAWLRTLPTLLKPWGFKVTTLADPQEFWTVLQAVTPDAIVLDVNMPQINGFELCQILRSDPRWQRLPVLFLSVLTDVKSQNQAFTVGADDYLCKPVMGIDLANRILNRLQRVKAWAS
ncbi:protein RcaC [Leptolyngbya sp. 'hensonii']|uniref:response regulator transcription factor n=1 Tax=Leptolyngbya sp. 'hensonii' TaxID=1922337 RepID=UPI00094FBDC7|nr:response regulator [Leptolyngbya sp. 'hensonii']OLP19335.1 protein RcaC [Leptolyngbya sp. 'hensonii']